MQSNRQYFRVDRKKIYFLKFIFEAYDGIASITTIDPALGVVSLSVPPGCEPDVAIVINELKKDILIEPIEPHSMTHIENCIKSGREER
jgi:hypothetical protein